MKPEPTDSVHDVSTDAVDTLTRVDRPRTTDSDLRLDRILNLKHSPCNNTMLWKPACVPRTAESCELACALNMH